MLSVNFSTPLAGPARSERIKQMSNNHPAFERSRTAQEILVKIQHSLRRMPGVSASESNEIVGQLQEVGQIVSQETSQLVDALMNLNLDQEDTDKAIARMSIEANLAKAKTDEQGQAITNLREELEGERNKKDQAEDSIKKLMGDLEDLTTEFKVLKSNAERQQRANQQSDASPADEEDIVKSLENTIQNLEEQVNKHRTLWVMRRSNPETVIRAIEAASDPARDKNSYQKSMVPVKTEDTGDGGVFGNYPPPHPIHHHPARATSAFQPIHRPTTAGPPPKFGHLHGVPPRPPTAAPHDRRNSSPWGSGGSNHSMNRSGSFGNGPPFQTSAFGRAPSRRGFQGQNNVNINNNNMMRYRADFPQSSFAAPDSTPSAAPHPPPQRPGSSFGYRGDLFPNTPTGPARNRYGRFNDGPPPQMDFGGPPSSGGSNPSGSNAVMPARNVFAGPPINVTEQNVQAWHEGVMDFYAVIRTFVERHASSPDNARSMKLASTPLWPVLLATYHPLSEQEACSYLEYHLRNENSKACLVTRVIIDFIVNRVWIPGSWASADPDSSYALEELEREMELTKGQPSAYRQPLLDRQAALITTIMKNELGTPFIRNKIEDTTSSLLASLQPLINKFSSPQDTRRDMERVADSAWELSHKFLTSRLTFDYRFPEIGSRFSSQSMLPIWPPMDPLELQAKHWRVALVTTPVVTCRNDTGNNISAHSVALADVFCMQ